MNQEAKIMRFKSRTKESGQAIVLIAMLAVILLSMLGLAIDGGGMFLLWRDAQNAVDTAALQAAFAYCTSDTDWQTAVNTGLSAASANGFNNNGVDNWVTIAPAPAPRRPSNVPPSLDPNSIMLVTIRAVKPSYFIQLVYGGPLEINVDTVGICSPASQSIYEGYALFAMGSNGLCGFSDTPNTGSTSQISPNGATQHYFGPMFSNGNASVGGGGGGIKFYDGAGVDVVGGWNDGGKAETVPTGTLPVNDDMELVTSFPPLYNFEEFMPANTTYEDNFGNDRTTTTAGQYWAEAFADGSQYATWVNGGTSLTGVINGLYVVAGDVDFGAATIGSRGVTIVALGSVRSTGNTNTQNNAWHPYVAGLTIMSLDKQTSPDCSVSNGNGPNGAAISFSGPNIIGFGVLYAPYSGISVSGSQNVWCGAWIANAMDRSGSNTWIFGQTVPNLARLQALGAPSQTYPYAGQTCDYINADTPPYYGLGD